MAQAGDVINSRYALRALIDSGATADVFLADDLRLGRQVAVKVLVTARSSDGARAVERFRREAQAAAALSHPHVVAVYDWGTLDDTAFLVMQYVAGSDLRRVLREQGRLAESTALRLAGEVASALEVAHAHGIVHRDVKPRNVLMATHGAAMLADFGIAAPTNGTAQADAVYGTALYVSPEQAQGLTVDGRGDVYSLGALLYEALTGVPPFQGETASEVARQHVSAAAVPPRRLRPEISAATEAVVLRALEKDPARRFASADEMARALRAAAERASEAQPSVAQRASEAQPSVAQPAREAQPSVAQRASEAQPSVAQPASEVGHAYPAPGQPTARPERAVGDSDPPTVTAARPVRASARRALASGPRAARWALVAAPLVLLGIIGLIAVPTLARARQASVPNLAGLSLTDGRTAVEAAGLKLTTEEQATRDTPAGLIVTQTPLPDAHADSGSTVHAVISSGVTVPDLSDQQCAAARAAVSQAGWSVKPVRWRVANAADFGKVVAQDPAPGSVVKDKGEISVQVAGPVRPC